MTDGSKVTAVADVPELGSYLFTARDPRGNDVEVILVRCEDDSDVEAWINDCPHENQRLDRGDGAAMRDGEIICPKHGSLFDACSGDCDNGPAAGTTLTAVEIAVDDGDVFLTDDEYTHLHAGVRDDHESGDEGPSSSSHLRF